ncbi:hypothetical protein AVEN_31397-1 [Araneus ventricosus]|uniref:Uncharacterized protein n=1 Tax=Araneus ventricosus TaxID=182803 RepID=A0A4Y2F3F4_ARAVE|nr:hypothetical protein AVEN_31397-1 [Araneus ventricosus]
MLFRYKPERICEVGPYCTLRSMLMSIPVCDLSPTFCIDGYPKNDFTLAVYNRFFSDYNLNTSLFEDIKVPLEEFFKCKIVSGSGERECDLTEHSNADLPLLLESYALGILKRRTKERFPFLQQIVMQFFIDTSFRNRSAPLDLIQHPAFSAFSSSTVQMAIHSPYISGSPYVSGVGFLGGKNYKVKVKENEKHLLPPPYQTNCTDYMPQWRARGGVGPLNQISVNRPVSDSVEIDCASNNVSSGVANTSTVDPAPVVEDFNQVRKNIYDIGNYCQSNSVHSLTNEEKISLVENVWKPQPVYKFPSTFSSSSSNHSRSFQMKWLEEFEWLAYSEEKSGSVIKYCVIFSQSKNVGKGDHQVIGALVTQAFSNLKKAKEMFRKHENCTYHKNQS